MGDSRKLSRGPPRTFSELFRRQAGKENVDQIGFIPKARVGQLIRDRGSAFSLADLIDEAAAEAFIAHEVRQEIFQKNDLNVALTHLGDEAVMLFLHTPQIRNVLEQEAAHVFVSQSIDLASRSVDQNRLKTIVLVVDLKTQFR